MNTLLHMHPLYSSPTPLPTHTQNIIAPIARFLPFQYSLTLVIWTVEYTHTLDNTIEDWYTVPGCCSSWSSSSLAMGILSLSLLSRTKIIASTSLKEVTNLSSHTVYITLLEILTHSNVPKDFDIFLDQTYHTHEMIFCENGHNNNYYTLL